MKYIDSPRLSGFALMDALIAVVVVGVGLFGIARLNSVMLASTSIAKTRAEATQLAEGKLEEIRIQQPPTTKPGSSTSPESIVGVNANFQRSWSITLTDLIDLDNFSVCVFWGEDCADDEEKKVKLHSLVTWTDLSTSAAIGSGQGVVAGGLPITPTGRAREGGDTTYTPNSPPAGSVTNANDGTSIYQNGGKTELIETATGNVLLMIDDGINFSTISGRVYITWGSAVNKMKGTQINMDIVNNYIRVLGSAGSVCRQFVSGGGTILPTYSPFGTTTYSYFNYKCYMSAGWWGNIAIVRFDGGDRVCLGDPNISQSDDAPTSRRPFLSSVRSYRGYTPECIASPTSTDCKSIGIGMNGTVYTSVNYDSSGYSPRHDFLLTTIKGQPSNSDCDDQESQPSLSTNPFTFAPPFYQGNTGLLFCLGSNCPFESGFTTSETSFVMTVNTTSPSPPAVQVEGGNCTTPTQVTSSFIYNCEIDWIGWAGEYWSGKIGFLKNDGTLLDGQLSNVALGDVFPSGKVVTLEGVHGIGCDGECIQFSSVSKDVASFILSVTAP